MNSQFETKIALVMAKSESGEMKSGPQIGRKKNNETNKTKAKLQIARQIGD